MLQNADQNRIIHPSACPSRSTPQPPSIHLFISPSTHHPFTQLPCICPPVYPSSVICLLLLPGSLSFVLSLSLSHSRLFEGTGILGCRRLSGVTLPSPHCLPPQHLSHHLSCSLLLPISVSVLPRAISICLTHCLCVPLSLASSSLWPPFSPLTLARTGLPRC